MVQKSRTSLAKGLGARNGMQLCISHIHIYIYVYMYMYAYIVLQVIFTCFKNGGPCLKKVPPKGTPYQRGGLLQFSIIRSAVPTL